MKQDQLESLLGRNLTPTEVTNLKLYHNIARETLESLICAKLSCVESPEVYDTREGYRTLFTDIFTEVYEVKIDGETVDEATYSKRQWDRRNGSWYNSLVFDEPFRSRQSEVEVTASWGFDKVPDDLQSVWAGLFDLITKKNKLDPSVTDKRVEDFYVKFKSGVDLDAEFAKKYETILSKYRMCYIPNIQHGGKW